MHSPIDNGPVSRTSLWTGRVISGFLVVFLVLDGVGKLIPLDVVLESSQQLSIPMQLARPLGILTLICALLYAIPQTSVLGAILFTGYLGGAIYTHLRAGSPLFTHTLFGVYLGLMTWGGLWLRDRTVRALIPLRRR